MILAIDIGSTNLKVGLFSDEGTPVRMQSEPMERERDSRGRYYFSAEGLWEKTVRLMGAVLPEQERGQLRAVTITSMAESGLLVDTKERSAVTEIIPWFDTASLEQAQLIRSQIQVQKRFYRTGLFPNAKQGIAKLLWLQKEHAELFARPVHWLSTAAYLAFRFTGQYAEDYSLAARTFAFDIRKKEWDADFIKQMGLHPEIFPPAQHCTVPVGEVGVVGAELGFHPGVRVYIAGHDQLVASLSVGTLSPGTVVNSIGTAETLIGTFPERAFTPEDAQAGLTFGRHLLDGTYYWMGGHGSSGNAVEWIRALLAEGKLSYQEMDALLAQQPPGPTGILFYPYLSGSGAPRPDSQMTASFLGITAKHQRGEMLKAVLEGNAYQMEWIRESAENLSGIAITRLAAVGGGTRNRYWMQVKATVSGVSVVVTDRQEAALQGAALVALTGESVFHDLGEAAARQQVIAKEIFHPNQLVQDKYRQFYHSYKELYRNAMIPPL